MKRVWIPAAVAATACTPGSAPEPRHPGPPVAPIRTVTETRFGITIADPYRWIEAPSDDTAAYFRGQADHARAVLDGLPGRDQLRARLAELDSTVAQVSTPRVAGGRLFYFLVAPGEPLRKLYVRDAQGTRLLVDPTTLGHGGRRVAIDWMSPSPDGALLAYGVSTGGSEDSTLRVLDVATGTQLADAIDRTQYATLAWRPDGRSFFYWREQPHAAGAPPEQRYFDARSYLHVVGSDPAADPAVWGRGVGGLDLPRAHWAQMGTARGSRWAFGFDVPGVKAEAAIYAAPVDAVVPGATAWVKVVDHGDEVTDFDVHGDDMYLMTHKRSSRYEVVHLDLRRPDIAGAAVIVAASDRVITSVNAAADALYVGQRDGARGHVLRVPYGGAAVELALPFAAGRVEITTDADRPGAYVDLGSWTEARRIYRYDPELGELVDTGLQPPWPTSNADLLAEEVEVASRDGTRVPLSIVHLAGLVKDGSHPTVLDGYGAYGASVEPYFSAVRRAWLERGGVLAFAHVRGGGERGEDWHQAGREQHKQHTIDDFLACARHLIDERYTTAARLAGQGTSAGGIVIGNAIVQHPELFGAAVIRVGDLNMTRHELGPSGPANIPEFGTAATEAGFQALYAMDAYLHVRDGDAYPAVLLTTGMNDPRVPSWMPGKMAARLQHATTSGKPVLLRVDYHAGHGLGSTRMQYLDDIADEWAFLLSQLGG